MSSSSDSAFENQGADSDAQDTASRDDWRDSRDDLGAGGGSSTWRESGDALGTGGGSSAWQDSDSGPKAQWSAVTDAPGLSLFFKVTLDIVDLGFWTKVSGLGMSIATDDRGESAMSFFQHHLPGHMTYERITLERPVSADSATVMNWVSAYHMLPVPTAGAIACVDQTGKELMSWEMFGVTPVSWKGPSFDTHTTNMATEVLTLAHMGFM